MKTVHFIILVLIIFNSCKKEGEKEIVRLKIITVENCNNFDVFLIAGQSNTNSGIGLDKSLDTSDYRIMQLGRWGVDNFKLILAEEPLQSHDVQNKIGFAMSFAREYVRFDLLDSGRKVLIIHCGMGGTGFHDHKWNPVPGDILYLDAIQRVNSVLKSGYGNKLKAILWHQGENDAGVNNYQNLLDNMINYMRKDLCQNDTDIPFILGGMVPYWVNHTKNYKQQTILENTTKRIKNSGYVDPKLPFELIPSDLTESIHYDAANQREFGRRYFKKYCELKGIHITN